MLSRECRILSELIVGRGLATPEAIERRVQDLEQSSGADLVQRMVAAGEIDAAAGQSLREEAREIEQLLEAEVPEGKMLGEFRLLREIGRGGMGIVYEAEQPSLARRVAIKILPATAALDEQHVIRFVREARTAARLNHPGIVPVYGTGREQGVLFFAMELVEGETLAERLERGPLEPREAARIAAEIARALHHAHEAGLIHRDVKPENVMLGPQERVRIADFGLVHDLRATRLTRSQYVLGTPAYTAPEQARDARVDRRVDVYAAGAVLYAMLTGRPPFEGEVPAAVLGRLLHGPPPPLARRAPRVPEALVAVCERAMARNPDERYPTAQALAVALDRFLANESHGAGLSALEAPRGFAGKLALAAGTILALTGAVWLYHEVKPAPGHATKALRLLGAPAGSRHRSFPTPPGTKSDVALSPDGATLAYVASSPPRIFLQGDREAAPRRLVENEDAQRSPAWSPDGTRIAYCRSESLEIVDVASGAVRATEEPCGPMSWSPDGTRIVYSFLPPPASRLRVFDFASGASRLISGPGAFWPAWSPDGRIAYVAVQDGQYDLWTMREDGSDPRRVTNDSAREVYPAWSSRKGVLLYGSNRDESPDLWMARLDPSGGQVLEEPRRVTRGWFGAPFRLSLSRRNDRLAYVHEIDTTQAWVLPLGADGNPLAPPQNLKADLPSDAGLPQLSPTGDAWIFVARRGSAENLERYSDRSGATWITTGACRDAAPRWSPDGSRIAFHSDRSGSDQIWILRADGTGLEQVTRGPEAARNPVWSRDGTRIAYSSAGGAWVAALDGTEARALTDGFEPWSWSPDGRMLAGTDGGIVLLDLDGGGAKRVAAYGERPVWVGDSSELLFTHEDRIFHWNGSAEPRAIWECGPSRLAPGLSWNVARREVIFGATASRERIWLFELTQALTE